MQEQHELWCKLLAMLTSASLVSCLAAPPGNAASDRAARLPMFLCTPLKLQYTNACPLKHPAAISLCTDTPVTSRLSVAGKCSYTGGYVFTTLFCEGSSYLPWLTTQVLAAGVKLQGRRLSSLQVGPCSTALAWTWSQALQPAPPA